MIPALTPIVDYRIIAEAKEFYEQRGFEEIAVPWIIGYDAYGSTRPPDRKEFYALGGYMNASGEQSFIELMLNGVELRRHLCITSCFRAEPVCDETHHLYFVKLELIDTDATASTLRSMINDAKEFFDRYFPAGKETIVLQTDANGEAFDIVDMVHGIELGSYGIRRFRHLSWVYGTGVALPRLSTVIKK